MIVASPSTELDHSSRIGHYMLIELYTLVIACLSTDPHHNNAIGHAQCNFAITIL